MIYLVTAIFLFLIGIIFYTHFNIKDLKSNLDDALEKNELQDKRIENLSDRILEDQYGIDRYQLKHVLNYAAYASASLNDATNEAQKPLPDFDCIKKHLANVDKNLANFSDALSKVKK